MDSRLATAVALLLVCACPAPLGAPCNHDGDCPEGYCEQGRCLPGEDPDEPGSGEGEGEGEGAAEGEGEGAAEGEGEGAAEGEGEGAAEGEGEGAAEGEGEGGPTADGTCGSPFALASGDNAGDTTGAASVIPGSETGCSGDGDGAEQVWRFDAPTSGLLALTLTPDAWRSTLHVRSACATAASELGCDDLSGPQTTNQLTVSLAAAGPVDVIVDGEASTEGGSYALSATFTSVVCGDGAVTGGEECDGNNVPGSCVDEGFVGGALACDQCAYDTGGCLTQLCGNDTIEGDEVCDGDDFGGLHCGHALFEGGALTCNSCTSITTGACTSSCGSGVLALNEGCDDGNLANGDGCSSTCTVSGPTLEQEAPDTTLPDNDDGAPNTLTGGGGDLDTNDFAVDRFNGPFSSTVLIQGSLNVPGDEDAFKITNTGGAAINVRAETQGSAGLGNCPGDTVITVRDGGGGWLAAFDDITTPIATSRCTAVTINNIPAGASIFVIVSDFRDDNAFGPYLLQLDFPP